MGNQNQKSKLNNESDNNYVYVYDENDSKKFIKCSDVNSITELLGTDRANIEKYKSWKKNKLDKKIVDDIRETNDFYEKSYKIVNYVIEL